MITSDYPDLILQTTPDDQGEIATTYYFRMLYLWYQLYISAPDESGLPAFMTTTLIGNDEALITQLKMDMEDNTWHQALISNNMRDTLSQTKTLIKRLEKSKL